MSAGKAWTWIIVFSIAMGFLEAVVVVYLRQIYYPEGFQFPLSAMSPGNFLVEVLREAATITMLAGVGILAGRNSTQRIGFFLSSFAIWDLSYYLFLKIILDWPQTWLTWDILFLIPVPWMGPVWAPVMASCTMLILGSLLVRSGGVADPYRIATREWILLSGGSLLIILSWTWDYLIISGNNPGGLNTLAALTRYVPEHYQWWTFGAGEILILAAVYLFWKRTKT